MSETSTGRFVWYELMTKDPEAAIAFYGDVIGWKSQPFGENSGYSMWVGSHGPLGGVIALPKELLERGVPAHWMSHVEVPNVDAAAAKAKELGATILHAPTDVPTVGRFAIIADPQGASISLFTPAQPMPSHDVEQGEFSWRELFTTDAEAALAFYGALVGWEKLGSHDMGPMGTYWLFGKDGKQLGGMMTKTKDMPMPSCWLYYVRVDDLESAITRAKDKGARLANGPHDVPGGSRIAQLFDPQGAMFAIEQGPKAEKAEKA